jgi:hypothetical protein
MDELPADLPANLPDVVRSRILAGLLRIHSKWLERSAKTDACFREAYDVYAASWRHGNRKLTDALLTEGIPAWVFHWAVTKKWIPYPAFRDLGPRAFVLGSNSVYSPRFVEVPESERTAAFGEYKIAPEERIEFLSILEGRVTHWRAEALFPSARSGAINSPPPEHGPSPTVLMNEKHLDKMARRAAELPKAALPPTAGEETVGEQLELLRQECRWSYEQLAEAAGFDPTTVARHISGKMVPSLKNLGKYDRTFSKQLNRKIVIRKTPGKRR